MNNPITVKIESNIDITDEQKNELREKLVYAFIEQLRKSGMYKVTEEKDGYAWILRADLILPKKHEAEPVKHGEWIFHGRRDENGRNIYRCSECNFEVEVFPYNLISWRTHEKYCPGCGAQMDGDNNG